MDDGVLELPVDAVGGDESSRRTDDRRRPDDRHYLPVRVPGTDDDGSLARRVGTRFGRVRRRPSWSALHRGARCIAGSTGSAGGDGRRRRRTRGDRVRPPREPGRLPPTAGARDPDRRRGLAGRGPLSHLGLGGYRRKRGPLAVRLVDRAGFDRARRRRRPGIPVERTDRARKQISGLRLGRRTSSSARSGRPSEVDCSLPTRSRGRCAGCSRGVPVRVRSSRRERSRGPRRRLTSRTSAPLVGSVGSSRAPAAASGGPRSYSRRPDSTGRRAGSIPDGSRLASSRRWPRTSSPERSSSPARPPSGHRSRCF